MILKSLLISKRVLAKNFFFKHIEIFDDYTYMLLMAKQIDLVLLFLIFWYFLACYSLLK